MTESELEIISALVGLLQFDSEAAAKIIALMIVAFLSGHFLGRLARTMGK